MLSLSMDQKLLSLSKWIHFFIFKRFSNVLMFGKSYYNSSETCCDQDFSNLIITSKLILLEISNVHYKIDNNFKKIAHF